MDGEVRPIEPKPLMVSAGDRRGQAPCSRRAAQGATRSASALPLVLDRRPRVPGLPRHCSGLGGRYSG